MRAEFGGGVVQLIQGNITEQQVDAIVNAANSSLAGGGGVDGAIHAVAGPQLIRETDMKFPNGCPTGSAVPSAGWNLPADYVFHAVGPIWEGGHSGEKGLLCSAYRKCLELAVEHECDSIAFPAISTGVYGYPIDLAAEATLTTVRDFLIEHERPADVRIVLFSAGAYGAFARVLESLTN